MTKRYFYTDHLAAAWMANKFGMQFQLQDGAHLWVSLDYEIGFWGTLSNIKIIDRKNPDFMAMAPLTGGERLIIKVDNLHLLNPQTGDVLSLLRAVQTGVNNNGVKLLDFISGDPGEPYPHIMRMMQVGAQIIMRNGKAFIWPESEE